jgi:hypothetical protein
MILPKATTSQRGSVAPRQERVCGAESRSSGISLTP